MTAPEVTVYFKNTKPTRLVIPTGSRIANVKLRVGQYNPEREVEHREMLQAKGLRLAREAWEKDYGPLRWSNVAVIIMHTDFDVIVELREDPA